MNVVSRIRQIERGWYYRGKEKYYVRECDLCGIIYDGMGAHFCSKSCSLKSRPFDNNGDKNVGRTPEERLRRSEVMKQRWSRDPIGMLTKMSERTWELSDEQRAARSFTSPKGKDNYNWKGGQDNWKKEARGSFEWRKWRESVFERDGYNCKVCGSIEKLEPHHITPLRAMEPWSPLAFDLNNGITLCRKCHQPTILKEEDYTDMFRGMLTGKMPQNFTNLQY